MFQQNNNDMTFNDNMAYNIKIYFLIFSIKNKYLNTNYYISNNYRYKTIEIRQFLIDF